MDQKHGQMDYRCLATALLLLLSLSGCSARKPASEWEGHWTGELNRTLCGETHGTKLQMNLNVQKATDLDWPERIQEFFGQEKMPFISGDMNIQGDINPQDKDAINHRVNYDGDFSGVLHANGEAAGNLKAWDTQGLHRGARFETRKKIKAMSYEVEEKVALVPEGQESMLSPGTEIPAYSLVFKLVPDGKNLKVKLTQQHGFCQNFDSQGETLTGELHRE